MEFYGQAITERLPVCMGIVTVKSSVRGHQIDAAIGGWCNRNGIIDPLYGRWAEPNTFL